MKPEVYNNIVLRVDGEEIDLNPTSNTDPRIYEFSNKPCVYLPNVIFNFPGQFRKKVWGIKKAKELQANIEGSIILRLSRSTYLVTDMGFYKDSNLERID